MPKPATSSATTNPSSEISAPPAPAFRLPAFSRWVSTAGLTMQMPRAETSAPASPSQDRALQKLIEPQSLLALAALESVGLPSLLSDLEAQASNGNRYYHNHTSHSTWLPFAHLQEGPVARLFSHFSAEDWSNLNQAFLELSSTIDAAASSETFSQAARVGARLIAHPASPTQLNYPFLALALREANTTVNGKRSKSLAGFELSEASPLDHGGRHAQAENGAEALSQQWEARLAELDASKEETSQVSSIVSRFSEFKVSLNEDHQSFGFDRFLAGGDVSSSSALLAGEAPLPSLKALKPLALAQLQSSSTLNPFASTDHARHRFTPRSHDDGVKSDRALNRQRSFASSPLHLWGKALLASLAPSASRLSLASLSPSAPLLADLHGSRFGLSMEASGFPKKQQPSIEKAQKALSDLFRKMNTGNRYYYHPHIPSVQWGSAVLEYLSKTDLNSAALSSLLTGLGADTQALGDSFHKRGAPIALLQVAGLFMPLLSVSDLRRQLQTDSPEWSSPHHALESGLQALRKSLFQARERYAIEALSTAEAIEQAWLDQAGFGAAWRQALAMGEPSARSIAWAMANPMSDALSSTDPIERLAGSCSRALGLSSKLDSSQVAADFREALIAKGATPEALSLLERSEAARSVFERLAKGITGAKKDVAFACSTALETACVTLSACARLGFEPDQAGSFLTSWCDAQRSVDASEKALADSNNGHNEYYNYRYAQNPPLMELYLAGGPSHEQFDGLGRRLGKIHTHTLEAAELLRDLGRSKSERFSDWLGLLAQDWQQTQQEAARLGLDAATGQQLAATRAAMIRKALPTGSEIDWRADLTSTPAWKLFGMPSPRFSAALLDARSRGGDLGAWVAGIASRLGLQDARDGNDLIAQARDHIKATCSMSEAAWKMSSKTPEGRRLIERAIQLPGRDPDIAYEGPALEEEQSKLLIASSSSRRDRFDVIATRDTAKELGLIFTSASAQNIPPSDATLVADLLMPQGRDRVANLFSHNIQAQICHGSEGAEFYCEETQAKRSRAPRVFIEAAKRLAKLKADAAKPPKAPAPGEEAPTPLNPEQTLRDEIQDLSDWISGSEPGLWLGLPQEPTWGQMRRLSKAWHDEKALEAMEKASRAKLAKELAEAQFEEMAGINPFLAKNSSRWAKLLGTHSNDGWEAVELLSSSDLTEEGGAMHHCVSSYSGTCREGHSRIFSIRLNGERVATLQISGETPLGQINPHMRFSIAQNKGPYNREVSKQCQAFCDEVLAKIQGQWPKQVAAIEKKMEDRKNELKELAKKKKEELAATLASAKSAASPPKP